MQILGIISIVGENSRYRQMPVIGLPTAGHHPPSPTSAELETSTSAAADTDLQDRHRSSSLPS